MDETPSAKAFVSEEDRYRWVVFALSYLLMFAFPFPLQSVPPLLDLIRSEVYFNNAKTGFLMGTYGIPGLFMPLAAAALAMRYDRKKVVISGLVAITAGLVLFALGQSYWLLVIGRLICGIGGKVVLSLAPLFVITAFDSRNLGAVIGLFNTAVPIGSIVALNAFGYSGRHLGWRMSIAVAAAGFALLTAVIAGVLRLPPRTPEEGSGWGLMKLERSVVCLCVLNLLINAVTMAYITFSPHYFEGAGVSGSTANFLASLVILEMAILGPAVGFVTDRIGRRRQVLVLSSVVVAVSFALFAAADIPPYVPVVLLGIGASAVPVVVFPLLRTVISAERMSFAIAALIIASNIGGTVGPMFMGSLLDIGGYPTAFLSLAAASLLIIPAAAGVPPDPPPETGGK